MRILKRELIGETMEVMQSVNKDLEGLKGEVLDETRNTIVLNTGKGRKTVPKSGSTFRINKSTVEGENLVARPEERIK